MIDSLSALFEKQREELCPDFDGAENANTENSATHVDSNCARVHPRFRTTD